ncbi:nuclear transport factor 2 family protein [Solihabitans fulvus]|uniref:Nuclear transport factor 2 family protein n=1 Tax=Solihabitans fulvus TaxID=1892852 RepID=A0A5B2X538_9PSEU|nr:nuclear transport factor 2 family protein [Solihabitans fulvus]
MLARFFAAEAAYLSAVDAAVGTTVDPGGARFADMAACLDPEVVMRQAPGLPYGGEWRGHAGIAGFMAAMSREWSSLEFLEQEFSVDGDTVMVMNRGLLRSRATGRVLDTWVIQWMTVRNGLVAEIRPFYWDTAAVNDTLCPQRPNPTP